MGDYPAEAREHPDRVLCAMVVLAVVTVALYLPILGGEFTYDARALILVDDTIHNLRNLPDILSLRIVGHDVVNRRRPMLLLSLMLDSVVWEKLPAGYHLSNVLLHAGCVLLLFRLLRVLQRNCPGDQFSSQSPGVAPAFIGALVFAVHPVNSEAVCNASYRADILVAFFLLAALNAALNLSAVKIIRRIMYSVCVGLFLLLSAASKESGAMGPLLLLLMATFLRFRGGRGVWTATIAASAAIVAALVAAYLLFAPANSAIFTELPSRLGGSLSAWLRIQLRLWVFQIQHIVLPYGLCADYTPYSIRYLSLAGAVAMLGALLAAALWLGLRNRLLLLAIAFFAVAMIPSANIIPIYRPVADRFLYQPMIAVAMLPVVLVADRRRCWMVSRIWVLLALVLVCGAIFVPQTVRRQAVWRDQVSLWLDTARKNPHSPTAHNNLGFAWLDRGEINQAVGAWRRAVMLTDGRFADAWAGMAVGLDALGSNEEACNAYREAIRLDGAYADPPGLVKKLTWEPAVASQLSVVAARCGSRVPLP
ncbi:MAG: hypothetical protein HYV35_04225 [Lentisphaerae bacterium]|nr:hypothetical protein [Lentisphaerota bacterium]